MAEQKEPESNHSSNANLLDSRNNTEPEPESNNAGKVNKEKPVPRYTERIQKDGYDFVLEVYGDVQELRRFAYEYRKRHGKPMGPKKE